MAKSRKQEPVTVGFVALGCPKNIVDSERMLAEIAQSGMVITAELENADVVVINTCGFIAPAKDEALAAIKHAVDCKTNGRVKKVIVAGCLSERLGRGLFDQADGIDAIVGLGRRNAIGRIIRKTIRSDKNEAFLDRTEAISDDRTRLLIGGGHWAYLRISEGCDHKCSFCTIPAIRGRFRSKPAELIIAEAAELVSAGVVEINVIAQDSTNWGRDLKVKNGLAMLLKELEKVSGLKWIRLMYLYPSGIKDGLIETIAESEKIVPYLDIPVQHISDKILNDMSRPDSKERIYRLIEKLRKKLGNIVLRTTVMVGFPGETEQQFNELLRFIEWAKFDALGCFRFYRESGTPAAEMAGQVPEAVKQQRVEEVMLTQQKIAFAGNKERIGTKLTCMVDAVDGKGVGRGRFYGQAPDIDSICIIRKCSAKMGQFVDARIVATEDYDLIVEQI